MQELKNIMKVPDLGKEKLFPRGHNFLQKLVFSAYFEEHIPG